MQELGLSGRVSFLLELLPSKPKPKPVAPPPENKLPHLFDLQVGPRSTCMWQARCMFMYKGVWLRLYGYVEACLPP